MLKRSLLAAFALMRPAGALASIHGSAPVVVSAVNFGAETLAGYGGYVPAACPLGVASPFTSQTNGSSNPSTDFAVNFDYDGVHGQIVPTGTYGTAGPTYNGPYAIAGNCVGGGTFTLTINIVAHMSSVKSQFGFLTHGDTNASNQMQKVFSSASNVFLGDTVSQRNDILGSATGIKPGFNPKPTNATYSLSPPSGGYTSGGGSYAGGTRIQITCDTQNTTGTYPTGQLLNGGSCDSGGWLINNTVAGSAYADPIDFNYYTGYLNFNVPPGTLAGKQILGSGAGSNAHGVNFNHVRLATGPNYSDESSNLFQIFAIYNAGGTISNSTFDGPFFADYFCNPATVSGVRDQTDACGSVGNYYKGTYQSFIATSGNFRNVNYTGDFFTNSLPGNGNPAPGTAASPNDWFSIGSAVYIFVSGTPTGQGQIPIGAGPAQTAMSTGCVIDASGGTSSVPYSSQGYSDVGSPYTCNPGVDFWTGETPDANVTATWKYYGPNWNTTLTAIATGSGPNSVALHSGSMAYGMCSDNPGGATTAVLQAAYPAAPACNALSQALSSNRANIMTPGYSSTGFQGTLIGGGNNVTGGGYVSSTGVVTLNLANPVVVGANSPIGTTGLTATGTGAGNVGQLDGTFQTATGGVGATTITFNGPTGLGNMTITGGGLLAVGGVFFYVEHVDDMIFDGHQGWAIASGSCDIPSGNVTVVTTAGGSPNNLGGGIGQQIYLTNMTGTGASALNGFQTTVSGTSGTTVVFNSAACSGGTVTGSMTGNLSGVWTGGAVQDQIALRGIVPANQAGQQGGAFINDAGLGNQGFTSGLTVSGNVFFHSLANSVYFQQQINPTANVNTALTDIGSDAYNPNDLSYDNFTNVPLLSTISPGQIVVPTCSAGCGGGTFADNLSNDTDVHVQTSPTSVVPNPNASLGSSGSSGFGGSLTLTQAQIVAAYQATFSNMYPGWNPATPSTGYQQNWTGVPGCPANTGLCNRAAVIWAMTPVLGATFTGTVPSSTGFTMTVTAGSVPSVGQQVNGPALPSGDLVLSVTGSGYPYTLGLLSITLAGGATTQTYGTGAMNPDGSYNSRYTPLDSNSQACRNIAGTVFDHTKTCVAQGLTVAS